LPKIAQGVDSLYAFAATARVVPGHLFDATHAALIPTRRAGAMLEKNPAATAAVSAPIARCADTRPLGDPAQRGRFSNSIAAMSRARFMSVAGRFEIKGWCPAALGDAERRRVDRTRAAMVWRVQP